MPNAPSFMAPVIGIGGAASGFSGGPQQASLNIAMMPQDQGNWCWAAVTQAILRHMHGHEVSQETIATTHMAQTGKTLVCSGTEKGKAAAQAQCNPGQCQGICNNMHLLWVIMTEQGCYGGAIQGAPSFQIIQGEITNQKPLACRVEWYGRPGIGHFILVVGYEIGPDGIQRVHVLDPARNDGTMRIAPIVLPYIQFAQNYFGSFGLGYVNYSYRAA